MSLTSFDRANRAARIRRNEARKASAYGYDAMCRASGKPPPPWMLDPSQLPKRPPGQP
jgi:hypothetical protein